jgi:hypothetical protein
MADSFTANYNLTKPEVGSSTDTWGAKLNAGLDTLDTTVKAVSDVANAAVRYNAAQSLTAPQKTQALDNLGGTTTGKSIFQAADAAAVRTAAGLGSMALQNSSLVGITGGTIAGITDLAVADGGTGASTAATARTNLGSTTVGDALFTAASAAAARTAIGATTIGSSVLTAADAAAVRTAIAAAASSHTHTAADITGGIASLMPSGSTVQSRISYYTASADLTAAIPIDDTTPRWDEGTEVVFDPITLSSASNKVRVTAVAHGAVNNYWTIALFRNASLGADAAIAGAITVGGVGTDIQCATILYEDAPGSVGPHTYSVRAGPAAGTLRLNGTNTARRLGGIFRTVLLLEEIKA